MARAVLQIDVDTSGVRRAMGDLRGTARTAQAGLVQALGCVRHRGLRPPAGFGVGVVTRFNGLPFPVHQQGIGLVHKVLWA